MEGSFALRLSRGVPLGACAGAMLQLGTIFSGRCANGGLRDQDLLVHSAHRSRHGGRLLRRAEGLHRPVRLLRQASAEPAYGPGALRRAALAGGRGVHVAGPGGAPAGVLLVQPLRRGQPAAVRPAVRRVPERGAHAAGDRALGERNGRVPAGEQPGPGVRRPRGALPQDGALLPPARGRTSRLRSSRTRAKRGSARWPPAWTPFARGAS